MAFCFVDHPGARYVWDKRPGHYFVEWWEYPRHARRCYANHCWRRDCTIPYEDELWHRRQAQFIGEQMNLGRQASSGTPQSLVGAPFLRPVAAC